MPHMRPPTKSARKPRRKAAKAASNGSPSKLVRAYTSPKVIWSTQPMSTLARPARALRRGGTATSRQTDSRRSHPTICDRAKISSPGVWSPNGDHTSSRATGTMRMVAAAAARMDVDMGMDLR